MADGPGCVRAAYTREQTDGRRSAILWGVDGLLQEKLHREIEGHERYIELSYFEETEPKP